MEGNGAQARSSSDVLNRKYRLPGKSCGLGPTKCPQGKKGVSLQKSNLEEKR